MERITYQTTIDLSKLTAFVIYWKMKERETNRMLMPQTFSELISAGFEGYVEGLLAKYPEIRERVEKFTLEDHLVFLRDHGFKAPERERYRRSVKRALEDEDLRMDSDTTREEYVTEGHREGFQLSKGDLEELERIKNGRPNDKQIHEAREGAKEYVAQYGVQPSETITQSTNETEAQAIERIAQKDAKLKKGLDEGPGSSTIIEEKGGD